MTGEIVAERVTVPLKPFVPRTIIVKIAVEPLRTVWFVGVMLIVKSGGGGGDVTATPTCTV